MGPDRGVTQVGSLVFRSSLARVSAPIEQGPRAFGLHVEARGPRLGTWARRGHGPPCGIEGAPCGLDTSMSKRRSILNPSNPRHKFMCDYKMLVRSIRHAFDFRS